MDACIRDRFSPCECCGRCKGKLASVEDDYDENKNDSLYEDGDYEDDNYHADRDNESDDYQYLEDADNYINEEFYYDDYGVKKRGE